jgi:CTP:molybdopterin cytidylyltransferase MocA
VINAQWREGLASSIRAGIGQLPASCTAAMLLVADQPAVTAEDLSRLTEAWQDDPQRVVAARYLGVLGVPCIFPRAAFFELSQLRDDVGARALLRRNAEAITAVRMPNAAIDIDRPVDLTAMARG